MQKTEKPSPELSDSGANDPLPQLRLKNHSLLGPGPPNWTLLGSPPALFKHLVASQELGPVATEVAHKHILRA